MGPCITISELTTIQGTCSRVITNHSKHHKNYRQFEKSLKDRGLRKHEFIPHRVRDDTRKHYQNPPGVPYVGHKTCTKIYYVMQNSENKPLHTQNSKHSIDVISKSVNHKLVNIWSIAMKFCYQTGRVTWCHKNGSSTTKQSFVSGVVM